MPVAKSDLIIITVFKAIGRELYVAWRFIDNDIWDTILPSLMIFFTAWIYLGRNWVDLFIPFITSLSYAVLYIYTFCISNQLDGIEEDRINKPYRPLVTGLVTIKSTTIRMYAYNVLYLLYALFLGIFWFSLFWTIVSFYLNMWGGSNHWVTKNLIGMTLGTFILFNVQWSIALPASGSISVNLEIYFLLMSAWAGFALPIQDLRDTDGDLKGGRKTLPIAVGDHKARIILSIHYFFFLPTIFLCAMLTIDSLQKLLTTPIHLCIFLIQLLVHWTVSFRLLKYKSPRQDHKTYHIFVLLFVAAIPMVCVLHKN